MDESILKPYLVGAAVFNKMFNQLKWTEITGPIVIARIKLPQFTSPKPMPAKNPNTDASAIANNSIEILMLKNFLTPNKRIKDIVSSSYTIAGYFVTIIKDNPKGKMSAPMI